MISKVTYFLLFQEVPENPPSTENKTQISQAEPLPLPPDIKTTPPPCKVQIICTAVSEQCGKDSITQNVLMTLGST